MKNLVLALVLLSTSLAYADVTIEDLNGQLESLNQANYELSDITDEDQLSELKNSSLQSISELRLNLDRLEGKLQGHNMRSLFRIGNCVQNDQDHGGLTDRGGSMIYSRHGDYRVCARVVSTDRSVIIHRVNYTINGRVIARLSGFGSNSMTVYEGKGKGFSTYLPTRSSSSSSKCFPRFGNELEVAYRDNYGRNRLAYLQIHPSLINFNGRSKYQVPMCNY